MMNYPRFHSSSRRSLGLLLGCIIGVAGAGALQADDRVAVRGKASPEYMAWKFGSGEIKNESYVFNQGRFFGGATHDRALEKVPFIDIGKSLAKDLVGQHYYPADSLPKANLLITIDWGVTTVAESAYQEFAQDNPIGAADLDAGRRDANHQMAVTERDNNRPTPSVQMLDQTYETTRRNGLNSDADAQSLDQKSMGMSLDANAVLVGFDDDLRADDQSAFGTPKGEMLRGLMADERYFVALNAYDCGEYLKTKKLVLVWTLRLSMRALDIDFRKGVGVMSTAGRTVFGHKTDGVEIKSPHIEIGASNAVPADAARSK